MAPKQSSETGTAFQVADLLKNITSSAKTAHDLSSHWFDTDATVIQKLIEWQISNPPARKLNSRKRIETNFTVLDPFSGTGKILQEARQAGLDAIGIDINPVAWFFAKTALEEIDANSFEKAFKKLTQSSGFGTEPLHQELHNYYKTDCPCNQPHGEKADILKIFWIQTAVCSNPMCEKRIPLFDDFIISQKKITVPFHPDVQCPNCSGIFDWDLKHASMISSATLSANSPDEASGQGRPQRHWAVGASEVTCPHCHEIVQPETSAPKPETKKVPISILFCPHCQEVWQYRGPLPKNVRCPGCGSSYYSKKGNIQQPDWYQCPFCGTIDKISISMQELAAEERFPLFPYAIEGHCPTCAKSDLHNCVIHQNNGHFFKKVTSTDLSHFLAISQIWSQQQDRQEFPVSKIISSRETQPLIAGNFFYWFQLFNQRQLLSLTNLLAAIRQENNELVRNLFLTAFLKVLEYNNLLVTYNRQHQKVTGIFDARQTAIPYGYTESNILGFHNEFGSFHYFVEQIKKQLKTSSQSQKKTPLPQLSLWCSSLTSLVKQNFLPKVNLIMTELPTSIDSRFLNWSDFYYVWLRLALKDEYSFFSQEHVYRVDNINYFPRRKDNVNLYFQRIKNSLQQARSQLLPGGNCVLILPQQPEKFWALFVENVFQAGLAVDFICPITTAANGKNKNIRLRKLVFGCRNLKEIPQKELPPWPEFIELIYSELEKAWQISVSKEEGICDLAEVGQRYWLLGNVLAGIQPYVASMLEEQFPLTLSEFFHLIYMLLDWVSHPEKNLPAELKTMDQISYLYLAYFCQYLEITQAELDSQCKGICDPDLLIKNRILRKIQRKLDTNYIVIDPLDRYDYLQAKYRNIWQNIGVQTELFSSVDMLRFDSQDVLIDMVHLLLGKLAYEEDIQIWLKQHPAVQPKIRAATQYLILQPLAYRELLQKLLNQLTATVE